MPGADCGSDHELLITKFRLEKVREFQKNIYFCFIDYFPYSSVGKESPCNAGSPYSWVGKIPWRRDRLPIPVFLGFPSGSAGKRICLQCRRPGFDPWVGNPWRRERLPTPVFWPGEFHGLHSPWGCKESYTIE